MLSDYPDPSDSGSFYNPDDCIYSYDEDGLAAEADSSNDADWCDEHDGLI